MSDGAFKTLSNFNWNASQSAAAQRAAVQSAFDSGEPLVWPKDTVWIDEPLIMAQQTHIMGHGCDTTNSLGGVSQLASSEMIDLLLIRNKVMLRGLHVHSNAVGGRGIVIGDNGATPSGCFFENVSTGSNLDIAFDMVGGQEATFFNCFPNAQSAAYHIGNGNSDSGDSRIIGGASNAWGPEAVCFHLISGGGWFIIGHKFGNALHHIKMDWNGGSSATLLVDSCGFEGCHGLQSCLLSGSVEFKRVVFKGNSWGNNSTAVAVLGPSGIWMNMLVLVDNVVEIFGNQQVAGFYLDGVKNFVVSDNAIDTFGYGYAGIFTSANVLDGWVGPNVIRNLAPGGHVIYITDTSKVKTYSPQP